MSKKNLLSADKYCVATFPTTHSALHAEKVLEMAEYCFLIVPIPREISSGCGLAMRFFSADFIKITSALAAKNIKIQEIYEVEKSNGHSKFRPL